jgi:hypothetical protein
LLKLSPDVGTLAAFGSGRQSGKEGIKVAGSLNECGRFRGIEVEIARSRGAGSVCGCGLIVARPGGVRPESLSWPGLPGHLRQGVPNHNVFQPQTDIDQLLQDLGSRGDAS